MFALQIVLLLATASLAAWGRALLAELEVVEAAELLCLAAVPTTER